MGTNIFALLTFFLVTVVYSEEVYHGVVLGELRNETMGLRADVALANATVVQLINFRINSGSKIQFFFTAGSELKHAVAAFEVLNSPGGEYMKPLELPLVGRFKSKRIVIVSPNKLNSWKFFGIVSENGQDFMAAIKLNKRTPQPFCCIKAEGSERSIANGEYGTDVGPITVIDHKTLKLDDFSLEGSKPPDAWVFLGTGDINNNTGKKAFVVDRDTKQRHCPIHEDYHNATVIVRLADGQSIYDVNYLSIFCSQFSVDFGSVRLHMSPARMPVPVHLPPISEEPLEVEEEHTEC